MYGSGLDSINDAGVDRAGGAVQYPDLFCVLRGDRGGKSEDEGGADVIFWKNFDLYTIRLLAST